MKTVRKNHAQEGSSWLLLFSLTPGTFTCLGLLSRNIWSTCKLVGNSTQLLLESITFQGWDTGEATVCFTKLSLTV